MNNVISYSISVPDMPFVSPYFTPSAPEQLLLCPFVIRFRPCHYSIYVPNSVTLRMSYCHAAMTFLSRVLAAAPSHCVEFSICMLF